MLAAADTFSKYNSLGFVYLFMHIRCLQKQFFYCFMLNICLFVCSCVQALYVVLPGLLDCNPFPVDSSDACWKGGLGFPEPVRRILQVRLCISTLLLISCGKKDCLVSSVMHSYSRHFFLIF